MTDAIQRFRSLFNEIGRSYGLTWVQDSNTNGKPDLNEIETSASFQMQHQWRRLSEPRKNALLLHSILTVAREVKQKNPQLIAEISGQPTNHTLVFKQTSATTGTDLTKGYLLPNYPPRHLDETHARGPDIHEMAADIGPRPPDAEAKLGAELFYKIRSVADSLGIGLLNQRMVEQSLMTPERKRQGDTAEITNFTTSSSSKKEGAKAILGYYFYTGVLTLDEQLRLQIDFEKKAIADQNLFNEVASAMGAGSQEQARAILAYQEHIPQNWIQKIDRLLGKPSSTSK